MCTFLSISTEHFFMLFLIGYLFGGVLNCNLYSTSPSVMLFNVSSHQPVHFHVLHILDNVVIAKNGFKFYLDYELKTLIHMNMDLIGYNSNS